MQLMGGKKTASAPSKSGGGGKWAILAVLGASPVLVMFIVPLVLILIIGISVSVVSGVVAGMSGSNEVQGGDDGCYGGGTPTTQTQREHVRSMIGVAKTMGISERGMIIATMVMLQESGIQNIANDGETHGGEDGAESDWPAPGRGYWLDTAAKSMDYPHDKWGNAEAATDHDSVGLYQQRASMGWGDSGSSTAKDDPDAAIKRLLDPRWTSQAFFGGNQSPPANAGLQDVSGWEDMELTVAAQEVQGSKYPSAYAPHESKARQLVSENKDAPKQPLIDAGDGGDDDGGDDDGGDSGGDNKFKYPLEEGTYTLTSDFGPRDDPVTGAPGDFHGGQDFGAPEGTPIHAIADGKVSAAGHVGGGFGYWVVIDHKMGGRTYSSVYGHILSDGIVAEGKTVKSGDVIAKVGNEGNHTTGFHLHLEIWDGGRFDGGEHVDPMPLLKGGPLNGGGGDDCGGDDLEATGTAKAMLEAGKKWLGTPYSWGGGSLTGPSYGIEQGANTKGFDCSGLVRYMVYQGTGGKNGGLELPRVAQEQYNYTKGNPVKKDDLQPGDLMFWGTSSNIHHVAMYWGDGKMIEAPRTDLDVRITEARLDGDYYGATRLKLKGDEDSGD